MRCCSTAVLSYFCEKESGGEERGGGLTALRPRLPLTLAVLQSTVSGAL